MGWETRKDRLQRVADSRGVSREYVRQWDHILKKLDSGQISKEQADSLALNLMDEHSDETDKWLGDGETWTLYS
jgi:hypothetical protein